MKVLLCNDTATKSHIGCQAVSDAHARLLGREGHTVTHRYFVNELRPHARKDLSNTVAVLESQDAIMAHLAEADALVVNGEGTLHHGNGLEYIALIAIAQRLGKATLLVNALFQEMALPKDALSKLDAFFVRDPRSYAYVQSMGLPCAQAPDSIIAAAFDDTPRRDMRGATLVTDWVKARDADTGVTCARFMAEADPLAPPHFYPLHTEVARTDWQGAVADVGTAGLVVSARYHGLYLATLAGVPFVPLASNSWKMNAFTEAWDLPVKPCADLVSLRAQLPRLEDQRPVFQAAQARLLEKRNLPIFEVLGTGNDSTEADEVARLHSQIATRHTALAAEARAIAKRRFREASGRVEALTGKPPKPAAGSGFGRLVRRLKG